MTNFSSQFAEVRRWYCNSSEEHLGSKLHVAGYNRSIENVWFEIDVRKSKVMINNMKSKENEIGDHSRKELEKVKKLCICV